MTCVSKIPPTFLSDTVGGVTVVVKARYKEAIHQTLSRMELMCGNDDNAGRKFGRGVCLSVPVKEGSAERFVIRDYRHGGLLGKLLGGVFCDGDRPLNEVCINEIALQKGVPSAEVIAITKKKLCGLFYRANFITREISGAADLLQFLQETPLESIQRSKHAIIRALVKLIRNMHDAGIYHADLHLKNILLKQDATEAFTAYIIDLDKSFVVDKLTVEQRMKNLLRLNRSIDKIRWVSGQTITNDSPTRNENASSRISNDKKKEDTAKERGIRLEKKMDLISKTDRIRFFKSYMTHGNTIDADWKKCVRQYHAQYFLHKLWWRVLDVFKNKV
ncbi:MAG: lipopolysaccharide kinase InaA family protein [Planctomycetota bacterium]|mgnify:FL=1